MKVALVHDWLTGMRGGEKVLEALCEIYPQADIFTLIYVRDNISETIQKHKIITSFFQHIPGIEKSYRYLLPLMPFAFERFNLSGYELIISTSHSVAKGVKVSSKSFHLSYIFAPMRYVWGQYEEYFNPKRASWLIRRLSAGLRPWLQDWDVKSSKNVNDFVAISKYIHDKVKLYYNRDSDIIFPPVDVAGYPKRAAEDYYLMVAALVPYKRVDMAIECFNRNRLKLKIIGSGPDLPRLKKMAMPNIEFLGWLNDSEIKENYSKCKAFIFPQEEDFGITAVEAQAAGAPVIAFAKGGALETVIDGVTGVYFHKPTAQSLQQALGGLERMKLDSGTIIRNAQRFSRERFTSQMESYITNAMNKYKKIHPK